MIPLLEIKDVNIYSGKNYRLKNVNISITEGEKVALVGKSGSGKTTLLKIANGVLPVSDGKVYFKGVLINTLKRKQKSRIATFWQDLMLIDELSVSQNIYSGGLSRHSLIWAILNLLDLSLCAKQVKFSTVLFHSLSFAK